MVQPIRESLLPDRLFQIYDSLEKDSFFTNSWDSCSEQEIWKELCFCLLSGNVAFELVKSTIDVLDKKGFLNYQWIVDEYNSQQSIFQLFNNPNFEPKKKNGELRKYRYPKKRSQQIVETAKIIYPNSSLKKLLKKFSSEVETRNYLSEHIPGLGIKESSHFLRNIGFSNSLAIIDVHVLNFLKQNRFVFWENSSLTTKKYCTLERILQNLAEFHNLDLAIFDLAVWHYMRSLS